MCALFRWTWMFVVLALAAPISLAEEADEEPQSTLLTGHETDFARRMFKITEIVLDKHVEPPTRQEMLLCGLTSLYGDSLPDDLRRAVSATATEDDFIDCLLRFWPRRDKNRRPGSRGKFLHGMGEAVPGGLQFTTAKEAAVERQLAANQYVGIGITLTQAENSRACQIGSVFPRGPAAKAGIRASELILEIDGTKTEGLSITDVIGRLRGAEGTTVLLRMSPHNNGESRLVTLIRSVVPRQTVIGWRPLGSETWDPVVEGDIPVAYLKISEIGGSTVSELREYEAELLARQVDTLILDLRGAGGHELRHAITLADALLDGGEAGVIRSRDGVKSVPLDRDCLFREWRMAVIVDNRTYGYAEWLAGLLQLHREALIVGVPTTGSWRFVLTPIELPGDWGVMELATAVLEREKVPKNKREGPLNAADENGTRWATGRFDSLLFRTTTWNRSALNGLHSVTPEVPIQSPASGQSDVVRRAVEALTSPKTARSKSQIDAEQ